MTDRTAPILQQVDRIASIGCILILLATVGALFGTHVWILELLTHFRVQYTLCLFGAALWWILRRRGPHTVMCLALASVHAAHWTPLYLPPPSAALPDDANTVRVVALNVRTSNQEFEQVRDLVGREQPDLLLLLEVNDLWMQNLAALSDTLPHRISAPREDNFGIALLSTLPIVTGRAINLHPSRVRPTIDAVLDVHGSPLRFLGLHAVAPASKRSADCRDAQLAGCDEILQTETGPTILAGDFNATPWCPCLRDLRRTSGLADSMQGFGPQASWPTGFAPFLIPLDHLYHSPDIEVVARRLDTSSGSDHAALIVDLKTPSGGSGVL